MHKRRRNMLVAKMKCFGHQEDYRSEEFCNEHCDARKQGQCYEKTLDNLGDIKDLPELKK